MNVTLSLSVVSTKSDINKNLLNLKVPRSDGLILNIHYQMAKRTGRFVYHCFHPSSNILAIADISGHIYFIDFLAEKYWGLPEFGPCSFIKFSEINGSELLIAKTTTVIEIVNVSSGDVVATLVGHTLPATYVSFADQYLCLTSSENEAIVWDLRSNTRLQLLSLQKEGSLKFVQFIPVSEHILACFQDEIIQIWQKHTYESLKQFEPSNWNNYSVKCVAFSRNGKTMVVAGHLPNLAFFQLDRWKLIKLVTLPEYILTVKWIEFVPRNFDGGQNQLLAVLSGKGVLHFYDIKNNVMISELKSDYEMNKFGISPTGDKVVCLLCCGEVEIYDLAQYIALPEDTVVQQTSKRKARNKKLVWMCSNKKAIGDIKEQIDSVLEDDKLRTLLREYGQYPDACRLKIWTKLLLLPDNTRQFNTIINHVTLLAFEDLYSQFPLENRALIGCLKNLLNNLVAWCPFFANVEYLPLFAFPFVKMFHANPVATFEVVCTVILNWCQHWFEYYPLIPVNILAIIDNLLMEHDPDLLQFLAISNVNSKISAWPLLETAFSEVLTTPQWLQFWDHVLSNEPSFLLCAVAAYSICQRRQLAIRQKEQDFEIFYHTQNPLNMKRFIAKTYYIFNTTSDKLHPRQYLDGFKAIESGSYPDFNDYPKTVIEFEKREIGAMEKELREIRHSQHQLEKQRSDEYKDVMKLEVEREQEKRLLAMKSAVMENIKSYQDAIKTQQEKLKSMRQELIQEEKDIIKRSRKIKECTTEKDEHLIANMSQEVGLNATADEIKLLKEEDDILRERLELLKGRKANLLCEDICAQDTFLEDFNSGKRLRCLKEDDIFRKREHLNDVRCKKMNIVRQIADMEKLISKIQIELQKETVVQKALIDNTGDNVSASALQEETKQLEREVSKLLKILSDRKAKKRAPEKTVKKCTAKNIVTLTKNVRFTTETGSTSCNSLS